jgi:antitoxin ParD1/3/4
MLRQQVETGPYPDTDAVLREALRLLRERDAEDQRRLEELRAEIAKGIASADCGELTEWDAEEIKAEGRRRLAAAGATL